MNFWELFYVDVIYRDVIFMPKCGRLKFKPSGWCWFWNSIFIHEKLQTFYEKYETQGLSVLAFPCNQFGGQEPGTDAEIKKHVQVQN